LSRALKLTLEPLGPNAFLQVRGLVTPEAGYGQSFIEWGEGMS